MKRTCSQCNLKGIKIGKVMATRSPHCEHCGTEYEVTRFRNLPYMAAIVLALLFVALWMTGRLDSAVFLMLCGAWLVFDFFWEILVPLRPTDDNGHDSLPV